MEEKSKHLETSLAWHQRFIDLDHPNPYIAYAKSSIWATLVFMFVCMLAIISTSAVDYVFNSFFPEADFFFAFLIENFGYAATLVSFLLFIVVMVVESRILIKKLYQKGSIDTEGDKKIKEIGGYDEH